MASLNRTSSSPNKSGPPPNYRSSYIYGVNSISGTCSPPRKRQYYSPTGSWGSSFGLGERDLKKSIINTDGTITPSPTHYNIEISDFSVPKRASSCSKRRYYSPAVLRLRRHQQEQETRKESKPTSPRPEPLFPKPPSGEQKSLSSNLSTTTTATIEDNNSSIIVAPTLNIHQLLTCEDLTSFPSDNKEDDERFALLRQEIQAKESMIQEHDTLQNRLLGIPKTPTYSHMLSHSFDTTDQTIDDFVIERNSKSEMTRARLQGPSYHTRDKYGLPPALPDHPDGVSTQIGEDNIMNKRHIDMDNHQTPIRVGGYKIEQELTPPSSFIRLAIRDASLLDTNLSNNRTVQSLKENAKASSTRSSSKQGLHFKDRFLNKESDMPLSYPMNSSSPRFIADARRNNPGPGYYDLEGIDNMISKTFRS